MFYALKDYIGEDTLNAVLAALRAAKAFQQPPYTTSYELLDNCARAPIRNGSR